MDCPALPGKPFLASLARFQVRLDRWPIHRRFFATEGVF
jgi:hypothetical protein